MNSHFETSALDIGHCVDELDTGRASSRFYRADHHARGGGDLETDRPSRTDDVNLLRLVEGEIIPRLLLIHQTPAPKRPSDWELGDYEDVLGDRQSFARLFLRGDTGQIMDRLNSLIERGASLDELYLNVLSQVAGALPSLLEEDSCTFHSFLQGIYSLNSVSSDLHKQQVA